MGWFKPPTTHQKPLANFEKFSAPWSSSLSSWSISIAAAVQISCAECGNVQQQDGFSKNQWGNGAGRSRCRSCVQRAAAAARAARAAQSAQPAHEARLQSSDRGQRGSGSASQASKQVEIAVFGAPRARHPSILRRYYLACGRSAYSGGPPQPSHSWRGAEGLSAAGSKVADVLAFNTRPQLTHARRARRRAGRGRRVRGAAQQVIDSIHAQARGATRTVASPADSTVSGQGADLRGRPARPPEL